jgi:hypothetical protein
MRMELRRLIAIMTLLGLVAAGASAQEIAAGARHSVALGDDGTVRAWGEGRLGQLGTGEFADRDLPATVVGPDGEARLTEVVAVAAGAHHTLAIRSDGSVWAWGDNTFGQLGNGQWGMTQCSARPVQVLGVGGEGISHPGEGTAAEARVAVPERPEAYPAAGMFGPLPAWGLYLRHAEGVTLRDVESDLRGTDARPAMVDETRD